ncbi:MAG: hypothetical protein ACF8QF_13800 [Phycisphaerales bacterium]
MTALPDIATVAVACLALAGLGALLAKILAMAGVVGGVRAAGILGGAAAGLLLGAAVLGQAAPDHYERWFLGGAAQRDALHALVSRQQADIAALRAVDITPVAIEEQVAQHALERAPLEAALAEARSNHALAIAGVGAGAFVLAMIVAGLAVGRRGGGAPDADGDLAIAAGLSSVVVATVSAGAVAFLFAPLDVREALAFGAAGAVGGTALSGRFLLAPAGRNRRVGQSAVVAELVGSALVAGGARGGLLATSVLIGVALSLVAPLLVAVSGPARRRAEAVAFVGVAPLVVAVLVVRLDPTALLADRLFWIGAIASAILHHDGRWIGAWIPWRFFGDEPARSEAWRRSGAVLESGVGMTQCGAAMALVYAGALPASLGAGLVVSAIVIEMAAPIRQGAAAWMDRGFGAPPIE